MATGQLVLILNRVLLFLDLFLGEKLEVFFEAHNLGFVVNQPSSEIPKSICLFSLEYDGSLYLIELLVTVKGEARKFHIDWCSNSFTIDFQKK